MRKVYRAIITGLFLFVSLVSGPRGVEAKESKESISSIKRKSFVLQHAKEVFSKTDKSSSINYHYSHYSHRSHASHYSHQSHYSHYSAGY